MSAVRAMRRLDLAHRHVDEVLVGLGAPRHTPYCETQQIANIPKFVIENQTRRTILTTLPLLLLAAASVATLDVTYSQGAARSRRGSPPARLPIGMNLAMIADWEVGFPFLNLMWGARPWLTRDRDGYSSQFNT